MKTGYVINALLYACWALCLVGGINFYISQSIKDKGMRRIVMAMAIAASSWSLFSGALGFAGRHNMAVGCFSGMIMAFDLYAIALSLFVARLVEIKGTEFSVFFPIGVVLSILDTIIYAFGDNASFVVRNGRTAYTLKYTWGVAYHIAFIISMFTSLLFIALKYAKKSELKRKKVFVIRATIINIGLVILSIPTTWLPLLGIPSFPSSGFAIMVAFVSLILLAEKNNTFSISQRNLTDAIYNQGKLGVIVLDTEGKTTDMNYFASKLLDIDQYGKYYFGDIVKIDEDKVMKVVAGEEVHEHFQAKNTQVPLSIHSVVYRDPYGDAYGTAVMLMDTSAEEELTKQLLEVKVAIEKREGIEKMSHQLVKALSKSIDAKDEYTNGHSNRVAKYSVMIAEHMGYDEDQLRQMEYSALLHDVGKIGVPNAIINKPGKLTDEEYDIIKKHPSIGDNILKDIMEIPQIRIGARWHHERVDGKGYPDRLKGNDIPEIARIIAMADAYDAMTSNRSYRKYLPQDVVRAEIEKNRGLQFDEQIADIMLEIIDNDTAYSLHEPEKKKVIEM